MGCPETRDTLLKCFKRLMDKNNDNVITVKEIDDFVINSGCIRPRIAREITGQLVMNSCDLDRNGILNLADWSHHNSCIHTTAMIERACEFCEKCK